MAAIYLIDAHPVARMAMRLELERRHVIVGETGDGAAAIEEISVLRPDLVIIDIGLPGMAGLDVLKTLNQRLPGLRCLVFTQLLASFYLSRSVEAGAMGFLSKSAGLNELSEMVTCLLAGQLCYPLTQEQEQKLVPGKRQKGLSEREFRLLTMLADGKPLSEIAQTMNISEKTVSSYKCRIRYKVGVSSLAQMINYVRYHRSHD